MLNQDQANYIMALYAEGAYDAEITAYLMQQGYAFGYFEQQCSKSDKFRHLISAGRILSKAYWERQLRNGSKVLPSWYYGHLPAPVLELITLACQSAEVCAIGSAEREREFRNVERLLRAVNKT